MRSLTNCPACGGQLVARQVEKRLRGETRTAVVEAKADVCLSCGERLYSEEAVRRFEEIRRNLALEESATAVRQALADMDAGNTGIPLHEFVDAFRKKNNIRPDA